MDFNKKQAASNQHALKKYLIFANGFYSDTFI